MIDIKSSINSWWGVLKLLLSTTTWQLLRLQNHSIKSKPNRHSRSLWATTRVLISLLATRSINLINLRRLKFKPEPISDIQRQPGYWLPKYSCGFFRSSFWELVETLAYNIISPFLSPAIFSRLATGGATMTAPVSECILFFLHHAHLARDFGW